MGRTAGCTAVAVLMNTEFLLRSYSVEEYRDDGKYHVRKPKGNRRRQSIRMYEHLAEPEEKDVGEGQSDTDTDIPADSSSLLL